MICWYSFHFRSISLQMSPVAYSLYQRGTGRITWTSHQYRNHVCEKCHRYIFLARVYRLCDAPYTYYKTDRDNQGYRKKAYIIHFRFASVFPSIYCLSLIFIFSLWLFFTLCIAIVWTVRIVRMFRLHTALFCAILQASFIV